jgi:hypothetical protein
VLGRGRGSTAIVAVGLATVSRCGIWCCLSDMTE